MMTTLYDLLGALPTDDAEDLRAAFRRAVKGAHPDLRPGDPDAALKFRHIVRANEILGDAEQRETYDHLLELGRQELDSASRQAVAARIHRLASGVMALAGASAVTVGGYLLFMHVSAASVAPANQVDIDIAMRAASEIADVGPAVAPDATDNGASAAKPEPSSVPVEAIMPAAVVAQPNPVSAPPANPGPAPGRAAGEAGSLPAREIAACRAGDLNGSIVRLDRAIEPDPRFAPAYIDRGTIFYRLRKFQRAFADIGRAKRTVKASRSGSPPTMARKPRTDQVAIAPSVTPSPSATSLFRRRTAAQDPSREETPGSLRLR
jgi:DnaJ domain